MNNDTLYNSKISNDKKWIIDNFDDVLDKYITVGGIECVYDNQIEIDAGNIVTTFILNKTFLKILAWAVDRGIISCEEFLQLDEAMTRSQEVDETIYVSKEDAKQEIEDLKDQIIDELLERNDWEFLKEREVTSE